MAARGRQTFGGGRVGRVRASRLDDESSDDDGNVDDDGDAAWAAQLIARGTRTTPPVVAASKTNTRTKALFSSLRRDPTTKPNPNVANKTSTLPKSASQSPSTSIPPKHSLSRNFPAVATAVHADLGPPPTHAVVAAGLDSNRISLLQTLAAASSIPTTTTTTTATTTATPQEDRAAVAIAAVKRANQRQQDLSADVSETALQIANLVAAVAAHGAAFNAINNTDQTQQSHTLE